jgi:hypothetical protein
MAMATLIASRMSQKVKKRLFETSSLNNIVIFEQRDFSACFFIAGKKLIIKALKKVDFYLFQWLRLAFSISLTYVICLFDLF